MAKHKTFGETRSKHSTAPSPSARCRISAAPVYRSTEGGFFLFLGGNDDVCGAPAESPGAPASSPPRSPLETGAPVFRSTYSTRQTCTAPWSDAEATAWSSPVTPAHSAVIRPPWLAYVSLDRNDTSRSSLAQSQSLHAPSSPPETKNNPSALGVNARTGAACSARCATKTPRGAQGRPSAPKRTEPPAVPEPADAARPSASAPDPAELAVAAFPETRSRPFAIAAENASATVSEAFSAAPGPFSGPSDERASPYPSGW